MGIISKFNLYPLYNRRTVAEIVMLLHNIVNNRIDCPAFLNPLTYVLLSRILDRKCKQIQVIRTTCVVR